MYRKQVRRRRAVLTLLILGSFLLLTITYGQGSGGMQRRRQHDLQPAPVGRRPGAEACPRPGRLVRQDLRRARRKQPPQGRTGDGARSRRSAGQEALQENAQLRKLVELDRDPALANPAYDPVTGRVIARSPTVWHSSVTIDVGSGDGVDVDDPVISGDGLVGEVAAVQRGSSEVNLITDHTSAVSAKVAARSASRA